MDEVAVYKWGEVRNAASQFYAEAGDRGQPLLVGVRTLSLACYIVSEDGQCGCRDYHERCKPAGIRCKHGEAARLRRIFEQAREQRANNLGKAARLEALRDRIAESTAWREEARTREEARRASVRRDVELLFC